MNQAQAEAAVTGSALVVGGVYIFRRLSETEVTLTNAHGLRLKQLAGIGPVLPVGPFVVGWGFTFLVLALMAQASPKLGGYFAILVATGAVLGNGEDVFKDLNTHLGNSANTTAGAPVAPSSGKPQAGAPAYPGAQVVVSQGFTVAPVLTH